MVRPRPRGYEHRGYTRVSSRRWIKATADTVVVPPHIQWLSFGDYRRAMAESVKHRDEVKDNPQRPDRLEGDFYEPEIFTVRRSNPERYLKRQDSMDEPTENGETRSKRIRYSKTQVQTADKTGEVNQA